MNRREALGTMAAGAIAATLSTELEAQADDDRPPTGELIIDTHQHLWDLSLLSPPWLEGAPEILRKTYHHKEYAEATRGLNVKAIYMEVDVAPKQHDVEAEHVIGLCRKATAPGGKGPTIAAVIGGRPDADDFGDYLQRHAEGGYLKGVRQVLHNPEHPAKKCLGEAYVRGVRLLGERGLSFDLCMRPGELGDGARLTELCPDTRFVVDHCGNPDLGAFQKGQGEEAAKRADAWRRDIERLAKRPNTICKISGVIAGVKEGWGPETLAPAVNHCLEAFGPDRVVFGGDWPVCLLGAPLLSWVDALTTLIADRGAAENTKLWSGNAIKFYGLENRG
jgi:L-fuconolactonase